jgi:cytochrome P450
MTFSFDPTSAEFNENPYPFYKRLRTDAPVYRHEQDGRVYWLISRYADVWDAVLNYQALTSERGIFLIDTDARTGKTLGTIDPPRHHKLRRIYNQAFKPSRLAVIEEAARAHARELVEGFRGRRSFEFVTDFAKPFYNRAIGNVIGIRQSDLSGVVKLIADIQSESSPFGAPVKFSAVPALAEFMLKQTKLREHDPTDDLMSILFQARAENEFATDQEIALASTMVVLAGLSTAVHFLGNLLAALHSHPTELRRLLEDPALVPLAVDEGARFDTGGQAFARMTTRDVSIAGRTIAAGERVVLIYASANHDESLTPNPERFLLSRGNVRHLGFGGGHHLCLGAPLARLTTRIALEELLPILGAKYDLDYTTAKRRIHFQFRGFERLSISF